MFQIIMLEEFQVLFLVFRNGLSVVSSEEDLVHCEATEMKQPVKDPHRHERHPIRIVHASEKGCVVESELFNQDFRVLATNKLVRQHDIGIYNLEEKEPYSPNDCYPLEEFPKNRESLVTIFPMSICTVLVNEQEDGDTPRPLLCPMKERFMAVVIATSVSICHDVGTE